MRALLVAAAELFVKTGTTMEWAYLKHLLYRQKLKCVLNYRENQAARTDRVPATSSSLHGLGPLHDAWNHSFILIRGASSEIVRLVVQCFPEAFPGRAISGRCIMCWHQLLPPRSIGEYLSVRKPCAYSNRHFASSSLLSSSLSQSPNRCLTPSSMT